MSWKYFSQMFMGVTSPVEKHERIQGAFYRGSRILTPIANLLHLPVDQANFVFSGFACFFLGQLMRHTFPPNKTSPFRRALIELVIGVGVLYFCFGNQIRVMLLQSFVAYALIYFLPRNRVTAVLVTVFCMIYLSLVHLCRLQYDYGGYTLDISGPIMVQTQRLTSLAFNLSDGATLSRASGQRRPSGSPRSPLRKLSSVESPVANGSASKDTPPPPSPVPSGPADESVLKAFNRYARPSRPPPLRHLLSTVKTVGSPDAAPDRTERRWVALDETWKSLRPILDTDTTSLTSSQFGHHVSDMPSPVELFAYLLSFHTSSLGPFLFYSEYREYLRGYGLPALPPMCWATFRRLIFQLVLAGMLITFAQPYMPSKFMAEDGFLTASYSWQLTYMTASLLVVRQKYYFAWALTELNSMGAGLGFSGYCPSTGRPVYSQIRSFNFGKIEAAVSLKQVIDNWNIVTTRWLREVFYDRLPPTYNTVVVFIVSAFWHGFYPGYYLMFTTFMLFTFVARSWRRTMRHHCRRSPLVARLYDCATGVLTNLAINYAQVPFHLLDLDRSFFFWANFAFLPHVVSVLVLLVCLPFTSRLASSARSASSQAFRSYFALTPADRAAGG